MNTDITEILLADMSEIDGRPMTTSRKVAARFKKQHKNVLQSIKRIDAQQPEFSRLNFQPAEFTDSRGKTQTEYLMTRDGFALLAMSFTGDEAMTWKIIYITAFNRMAEQIAEFERMAAPPTIPASLYDKALAAEKAEAVSASAASIAGRTLRQRRTDKPELVAQVDLMREAVQLCLTLGLSELPALE